MKKRLLILITLICISVFVHADTAIKLGFCAYGSWSKYSAAWYSEHAQLIVAG